MTFVEAYGFLAENLTNIYDDREASTISRYLIEDIFNETFWSEKELTKAQCEILQNALERLLAHEPWQYIGGYADFYGFKFIVNPSVLIPRPETEELVYMVLDLIKHNEVDTILDIGTGSGIIPISLAKKSKKPISMYATDISLHALKTAQTNADMHHVDIEFIQNDILEEIQWNDLPKVRVVISNPPYISMNEKNKMSQNVVNYEPHTALFVKDHPIEFYFAIAKFVVNCQYPGCFLLTEINENHGDDVKDAFENGGLENVQIFKDLQGKDRIAVAQKPN